MRVLFVNPAMERYTRQIAMPLGLLSIASYLQANGHTVRIPDRTVRTTDSGRELDFTLADVEKYLGTMYGRKKTALLYMAKGCIGSCSGAPSASLPISSFTRISFRA